MIKDRIIQLIEYKGIAKENFYKKIGVTSANFRGKAKESDVVSITIAKILSEIPDANVYWLITGEGEMLTKSDQNLSNNGHGNQNINNNGGNVTISKNDVSTMIELQKGYQEIQKELTERLKISQDQINTLLEIIKNK